MICNNNIPIEKEVIAASLLKQASSKEDNMLSIIGATLATPVYYTVYKPLDAVGALAALAKGPQSDSKIREMNDPKLSGRAVLPGVASYRNTSRNMNLEKKFHNDIAQTRSEALGQWTTFLGGAALGARYGKPGIGALSAVGANVLGAITGRVANPRTLEQQQKYYDNKLIRLGNYLVPGMAAYNRTRTLNISDAINS